MPFAAPPVGENRFRAPQPLAPVTDGIYDSGQAYDFCPQRTVNGSEDCLYLGLFSRPWSLPQPLHPVIIVYFGGGFIEGGSSFIIPPAGYPMLYTSLSNGFILVYPTTASTLLASCQEWKSQQILIQTLMQDFSTSRQHCSTSSSSEAIQRTSVSGANLRAVAALLLKPLPLAARPTLLKALASSFFWPKTYRYDGPESQLITTPTPTFQVSGSDSLKCLKAAEVQTLRTAALYISGSHTYNTSPYTWAPVIGDTLLQSLFQATINGNVNIDCGFGMYESTMSSS